MTKTDEEVALEYVRLCGKLAAIVEWCVKHDGETLADNPHQLAYAKNVMATARQMLP